MGIIYLTELRPEFDRGRSEVACVRRVCGIAIVWIIERERNCRFSGGGGGGGEEVAESQGGGQAGREGGGEVGRQGGREAGTKG